MPCGGLKLTNPRWFVRLQCTRWERCWGIKDVIGQHGSTDVNHNRRLLLQLCCNNVLCIMNTSNTEICTSAPGAEILGLTVSHWFLHSFNWLVPISVGPSLQKGCRTADRSPPGGLQLASWKIKRACRNVQDQDIQMKQWKALANKDVWNTFVHSVSSLFLELPECTANAEAESQFKAAVASSPLVDLIPLTWFVPSTPVHWTSRVKFVYCFANVLFMAYHTSRYIIPQFAHVRFWFCEKVLFFVRNCETIRIMHFLCFPWQPQSVQCLQDPE